MVSVVSIHVGLDHMPRGPLMTSGDRQSRVMVPLFTGGTPLQQELALALHLPATRALARLAVPPPRELHPHHEFGVILALTQMAGRDAVESPQSECNTRDQAPVVSEMT